MSDWRDVMQTRSEADSALSVADKAFEALMTGRRQQGDTEAAATLTAARAICLELRALGTIIDYASRADA